MLIGSQCRTFSECFSNPLPPASPLSPFPLLLVNDSRAREKEREVYEIEAEKIGGGKNTERGRA